ncbi:RIP metalloprotease RseP [Candidatus Uhrbacteria bacterium]|nr:RIP metalloprotease RseP [Candidatus Uhrbacteria bacterium]
MLTLLIFLLVLSVLVFVHEFGHFITAKRAGLRVDEFGFGFPPRLVGFQRINGRRKIVWGTPKNFDVREGNTLYSINWLPFGGFVRIKGEGGQEAEDQDSFATRGAGVRVWIIAAGVLMNLVLAVALMSVGYLVGFPQVVEGEISKHARVSDRHIQIMGVLPDGPAGSAGLKSGVRLLSAGGREVKNAEDFKTLVTEALGRSLTIQVERENEKSEFTATPIILEETGAAGIGVAIANVAVVRYPFWLAVPKGAELTIELAGAIVTAVGGLIRDAVIGKPVGADLAGPVGIAVLTGEAARQGFIYLLQFVAVLSINLAILNIIPFPALDGGRILFIILEKLRGRPVGRKVEAWIHGIGFAFLIFLVLAVTVRDVGRYGGRIMEFFKGLI